MALMLQKPVLFAVKLFVQIAGWITMRNDFGIMQPVDCR